METTALITHMTSMAFQAGQIAMSMMADSQPTLKPDQSVLTQADLAASRFLREELKPYLSTGEHILIDEEDQDSSRYFDQAQREGSPYIWVIDPIDGTRAFSNRMPLYGVSIGVLKDLKPWLGMVYLPGLKELFFADGQEAWFATEAFTPQETRVKITPVDQEITRQSIFFGNEIFFREFDWDYSYCQVMLPSCAVIDLCWPAVGRGCGCFFDSNLWDFAGSWPIFRAAGLDLRSVSSGGVLDHLDTSLFLGQGSQAWKLKDFHVLSSERNFDLIRQRLTARKI